MKEVIIYALVGVSSLTMFVYTIHMFLGGIVSEEVENMSMLAAGLIGAVALAFLGWDIARRRRS